MLHPLGHNKEPKHMKSYISQDHCLSALLVSILTYLQNMAAKSFQVAIVETMQHSDYVSVWIFV